MKGARRIAIWVIALVLVAYVVGTIPILLGLIGHRGMGQSFTNIFSGLYFRFIMMGILLYVLVRLKSGAPNGDDAK
ncbi:MAG TPA: hypothetical protein VN661_00930 [Candidatus Acidoferrales bacterium]|nr:hypothetical protein [Candidatus Acidoferrales bacterium]